MQRLILEICIFAAVAAAAASAAAVGGEGNTGTPTILTSPGGIIEPRKESGLGDQTWIINISSVIHMHLVIQPSASVLVDNLIEIYEYSQDNPSQSQLVFRFDKNEPSLPSFGVKGPVMVKLVGDSTWSGINLVMSYVMDQSGEFESEKSMQLIPYRMFQTNQTTQQCTDECTQVASRTWMTMPDSTRSPRVTVQLQQLVTQSPADKVAVYRYLPGKSANHGLDAPIGFWNSESKQPFQPITLDGAAIVMWMRDVSVEGERDFQFSITVTEE